MVTAPITRKLFTTEEFHTMVKTGIFHEDDRVELINGEIIEMAPIGHRHILCVNRLTHFFATALAGKTIVSIQNSVELGTRIEPQPDVALFYFRADFYQHQPPTFSDTAAVVEVSDTTLAYDRGVKIPLYAKSGINEFWIVDVDNREITSYTNPQDGTYQSFKVYQPEDSIHLQAFPEIKFNVIDFLGEPFDQD